MIHTFITTTAAYHWQYNLLYHQLISFSDSFERNDSFALILKWPPPPIMIDAVSLVFLRPRQVEQHGRLASGDNMIYSGLALQLM